MSKATKRAEMPKGSASILNYRSLEKDYATLIPLLKEEMRVLDIGCGTGAITLGIAKKVGETGQVIGLDSSKHLIKEGKDLFDLPTNLELIAGDLFSYEPETPFDLIVSARVLQWLSNPKEALAKMKTWLNPNGQISILDYNHEELEWSPEPPESMQQFYAAFLKWKKEAGMNNRIAEALPIYFEELGFHSIKSVNANEVYQKGVANFLSKIGIWTKVAESRGLQMQIDGYVTNELRLQAIEEYNEWIQTKAKKMVMKLNDVRATYTKNRIRL